MKVDAELLTLEEAQQILRFSKSKLYAERRSGRLLSRRFGARAVRIHREDLDRYIRDAALDGTELGWPMEARHDQ
jgi:excisionase family DNA binding protein